MLLSHPEAFAVRDTQNFPAFGTEINIALAKRSAQFAEPDFINRLFAVRTDGLDVFFLTKGDHGASPVSAIFRHFSQYAQSHSQCQAFPPLVLSRQPNRQRPICRSPFFALKIRLSVLLSGSARTLTEHFCTKKTH